MLILASLSVLAFFDLATQMSAQGIIYRDEHSYYVAAENLYVYHRGHQYRPLGIALLFGWPFLFGCSGKVVFTFSLVTNVFCWIGTVLLTFAILKNYLSEKRAFWVAFLSVFLLGNLAFLFRMQTESVYLFMIMSAFYLFGKYHQSRRHNYLAIAISLLLFAILVRPGTLGFSVLLLLFHSKDLFRGWRKKASWFVYAALFALLLQCAGLRYQFGNFTVSYIDAITYYNYLGSKAAALREHRVYNELRNPRAAGFEALDCPAQKKAAAADLRWQLQNNSRNMLRAYGMNLWENMSSGNLYLSNCRNVKERALFLQPFLAEATRVQNLLFSILALIVSVWMFFKRKPLGLVMALFTLYTLFMAGISCAQGDRFNAITFPLVLIMLGIQLAKRQVKPFSAPLQKASRLRT